MIAPICYECKHYRRDKEGLYFCLAYPNGTGIPDDILFTTEDRYEVRPDQKGDYVFEQIEKDEEVKWELGKKN
ncbi:hypothetical protein [Xanthovirga aplysinae]|uniref:hypothetical protein n=1 Tax=Xanthovirga aplysinae TaxID=2529853 RepID=UPI0012BBE656|nr:hypothetical protein [Xanthovirga aplysinae]MTI31414.1 hypothetical protein [Xanthovirga aplysinae]